MEARDIKKLYYSISEVSEITGLKQYVLRYWETEFSQLKPNKNRAGNRTYKSHDVDLILKIKSLLYDRKFTIKGAKQHLKSLSENENQAISDTKVVKMVQSVDIKTLKRLRADLSSLIDILKHYKD
tara:strand:+ start:120 stop:497 length:378 start_codon:yes stop_codon:yes gene_type:complete